MADNDTLNDQIRDAVAQIQAMLAASRSETSLAVSQQLMVNAAALAMLNAVAQQQHAYVVRNAVTAAAARALLESDPEKAVELARELLDDERIGDPLAEVGKLMRELVAAARTATEEPAAGDGPAGTKTRAKAARPKRKPKQS